ncbi:four helix bundle protein [Mucilaginibacter jinjuensis]|uniref:Four helix bundle protein n=1 Tax=Mucilaginibacter jinjuensis TaxID=1176721 RepID=A0ABY7TF43_9SPHI|nr:four helix bundle protein [Mucilaginibacter jinjuensis]WCT15017.1 four helix bundle protein [Mucilaginibacter jinjuensis]
MASPIQNNVIVDKNFQFAVNILKFAQILQDSKQFILSNQMQRSGTSIGANIREAQNAESKADFIHKFKIAAKEAEETEYWLLLCKEIGYPQQAQPLLDELFVIQKIVTKIISTTKNQLISRTV